MMIRNKFLKIAFCLAAALSVGSCSDFLNQKPDTIFDSDKVFSDESMIRSVLANFYGQIDWGPRIDSMVDFGLLDEACYGSSGGGPTNTTIYSDTQWRVYPYTLIRNFNQFLRNVRTTTVITEKEKLQYEAEVRFLRAWAYFCMARGMGGMPIMGDEVFSYDPNQNVEELQYPRSTEAAIYDYIISECDFAAKYLPDDPAANINASQAISWVALALKARAAIYAGSLAKYNNQVTPQIQTPGHEVGIPANLAEKYYKIAYQACDTIIKSGKYALYNKEADKAHNFYMATSAKTDNPEIMWAKDFKFPGHTQRWSVDNCPAVLSLSSSANNTTPLLNLVEAFEYLDNRDGHLNISDSKGNPIFYDNPGDIFANKDPRLKGTVLCNGDEFNGTKIIYQAGQLYYQGRKWRERKGALGSTDEDGDILTSQNGPEVSVQWNANKTGFNFRKFLDESSAGMDITHGSEIRSIRFRYAEILLIASEACLELGQKTEALRYINQIRSRAGLKDLSDMTLLDIEQERRVEFALEDHRWWDLKRWRRAHIVWDGQSEDSRHYVLFPFRVKDNRRQENGKWAYIRKTSPIILQARTFRLRNYYNFLDDNWLANNPKLVKNPYQ